MSSRILVVLSVAAFMLVACGKKKEDDTAPAASTPAVATVASAPAAVTAAPLADKDLPVKAEFAGAVRKQITRSNYKAELDKAEQDVAKK